MTVKFKCIATGNIFEFLYDVDIETTRQNPAYEEIEDGLQEEKQNTKKEVKKATKPVKAEE